MPPTRLLDEKAPAAPRFGAIARRLIGWAVVVGFAGAVAISSAMLTVEYHTFLSELESDLTDIGRAATPPLEQSVWKLDHEDIVIKVESLAAIPQVTAVEVWLDGALSHRAGPEAREEGALVVAFPLVHRDRGRTAALGELVLIKDVSDSFRRFLWREAIILFCCAIVLFSVALAVAFAYNRIASRRMLALAHMLRSTSAKDLREAAPLDEAPAPVIRDELDEITASAAQLRETARVALRAVDHQAMHDPLTGLANRRALLVYLERVLKRAAFDGQVVSVLHIDLDRFKKVNDAHGHAVGDQVLLAAAEAMRGRTRPTDYVARVGGDEFAIVLHNIAEPEIVRRISEDLIDAIGRPVGVDGAQATVGASVGAAFGPPGRVDADRLLANADLAMVQAKAAGGKAVSFFSDAVRSEIEQRDAVAKELRDALARGEIVPFFQPQVDYLARRVVGLEALVRWRHPERGVLAPGAFLQIAVDSGLGDALVVVDRAIEAMAVWRRDGCDAPHVALNVAARQLRDAAFVDALQRKTAAAGLSPNDIAVEVLESVMLGGANDPAVANVRLLGARGYAIELDDFGTGYASISNLRKFKVDRIKIDRSLIAGLDQDPAQATMARALIDLARTLGVACLAEGVETEAEADALAALGCAQIQGYLIAKPMSFEDATAWLQDYGAAAAPAPMRAAR